MIASANSALVLVLITSRPKLAALAARSIGSFSPSSRPLAAFRFRYDVPNRCEPRDSDSEPMEAKPWFWTSTVMILMSSCTAVASSVAIIRYDPSPTITNTSRSGQASRTPRPPATS